MRWLVPWSLGVARITTHVRISAHNTLHPATHPENSPSATSGGATAQLTTHEDWRTGGGLTEQGEHDVGNAEMKVCLERDGDYS